jgi:hypothetical protein
MSPQQDSVVWVQAYEATDEWTANLVLQALRDAGIPAVAEGRAVTGFGGALTSEPGVWADIMVPEERLQEALAVMAADTAPSDEALPDA